MTRFLASFCAGSFAFYLGKALHVPEWQTFQPGDCVDLSMFAFFGVFWAIGSARKPA